MGVGAILEPLVVIVLLFGGTWINRSKRFRTRRTTRWQKDNAPSRSPSPDSLESGQAGYADSDQNSLLGSPTAWSPSLLHPPEDRWRKRQIRFFTATLNVTTPNTAVFQDRLLSRVLQKFPFLVEVWYWALVYWTYQLARAFTALTLKDDTVDVARKHALQLIKIEEKIGIFWETSIQGFFLQHPALLTWINWTYSFIHIPGTIAFLVWLYYYTTTRNRIDESREGKPWDEADGSPAGTRLYQARRRTLAVCNLFAFVVFTFWPCMPPRLLSDLSVEGPDGELGRSYGFVDTVHGVNGAGSVWTENRFCNQYAAMPSLHFGYSLMIGLTIMTIPLPPRHRPALAGSNLCARIFRVSWRRLACCLVGFAYPFLILVAIVATANHFILDAVAGAMICALGWTFNGILLNLLPLEDYFLWLVRIHKPEHFIVDSVRDAEDWDDSTPDATLPS